MKCIKLIQSCFQNRLSLIVEFGRVSNVIKLLLQFFKLYFFELENYVI